LLKPPFCPEFQCRRADLMSHISAIMAPFDMKPKPKESIGSKISYRYYFRKFAVHFIKEIQLQGGDVQSENTV